MYFVYFFNDIHIYIYIYIYIYLIYFIIRAPAHGQLACVLAGGLRLVTEGYRGVPPQLPTRGHQSRCNLLCILRMAFKNIMFYGVSGPSVLRDFIGTEKMTS